MLTARLWYSCAVSGGSHFTSLNSLCSCILKVMFGSKFRQLINSNKLQSKYSQISQTAIIFKKKKKRSRTLPLVYSSGEAEMRAKLKTVAWGCSLWVGSRWSSEKQRRDQSGGFMLIGGGETVAFGGGGRCRWILVISVECLSY
jgi:hypothetical protein